MSDTPETKPEAATSEWACVEIFGHRRHYGRVSEIERFGAKFLHIEVIGTQDDAAMETLDYAGGAVFSMTPMTEEACRAWAERERPRQYKPMGELPPPERRGSFFEDEADDADITEDDLDEAME